MNDLGTLSHCMMDGDPEAARLARRLRSEALLVSLFFETLLVAGMLVLPLITPGVPPLGPATILAPLVPFAGVKSPPALHNHANPSAPRNTHPVPTDIVFPAPTRVPTRVDLSPDNTPPAFDELSGKGNSFDPGVPGFGPGMPDRGGLPIVVQPPVTKPRRISIGVMEASLINRVDPIYPVIAISAHISGEVKLRATIATDGTVKDYAVVSGNPLLVRAAIAAIRQWRYRPTLLNGEAVEVETLITVNFMLQ